MDKHPIALERVYFTRTVVVAVPNHRKGGESKKTSKNAKSDAVVKHLPKNTLDVSKLPEDGRYIATMRTKLNPESDVSDPYHIDMECIGFFRVDETLSTDEAMLGLTITAHSVLYGAIRESVLWITGRHPYGPLTLGLSVLPRNPAAEPPASDKQPKRKVN